MYQAAWIRRAVTSHPGSERREGVGTEQIEEQQKTRARADKEELVKLEKFQKELRGKQYSYDAKGNLVMLAPVDPDKLPNNQLMPAHKLLLTQAERDAAEAEAEAKKGKKGTASRAEPADKKKSNHSANVSGGFTCPVDVFAPMN